MEAHISCRKSPTTSLLKIHGYQRFSESLFNRKGNSFTSPSSSLDITPLPIKGENQQEQVQLIFHPHRKQSLPVPGYNNLSKNGTPEKSVHQVFSKSSCLGFEFSHQPYSPDRRASDWPQFIHSESDDVFCPEGWVERNAVVEEKGLISGQENPLDLSMRNSSSSSSSSTTESLIFIVQRTTVINIFILKKL